MPPAAAIYLVRHGEAMPPQPDGERPLTPKGRVAVARLSDWCAMSGAHPHAIHQRGVRGAKQTATILASRLAPADGIREVPGLAPDDDAQPWLDVLLYETEPLMLVTHMPFVGELASLLVTGRQGNAPVNFA